MELRFTFVLLCVFSFFSVRAQMQKEEDSSFNGKRFLDEVVITGTRTENKVSNIPLPIQVISAAAIQQSGSQKLLDILQMQTGLMVATNPLGTALQGYPNPFGDGIQMQGMDPSYTLILIDGEPITGRNAGIINLGRIAVGNIKQIEILKGPATSLYGSDALAGVINIITKEPKNNELSVQTHYSTNNTLGLTASANIKSNKAAWQFFGKRYSSDGYDFNPDIYGQTVDPYTDYAFSGKFIYDFNEKSNVLVSARYSSDDQKNKYLIYPDDKGVAVGGNTLESDKSVYVRFKNRVHNLISYSTSVYATNYSNNARVYMKKGGELFEHIGLSQNLIKPEIQLNIGKDPSKLWVTGAGYNWETVSSTRYSDDHQLNSWYLFAQKQFVFNKKTNVILGTRYDKNMLYSAQISPKIAVAQKITPDFIIKGSIGTGFKAPDFRQQFLNFDNSMVGYTIIGAKELRNVMLDQIAKGLLENDVNVSPYLIENELSPEKSVGVNLGFDYTHKNNTVLKLNLFRNDITNLIESFNIPFNNKAGQGFFSYKNVNKVFTQGVELNINHKFNNKFSVNGSYQYLTAKDKEVIQKIKNREMYRRDPETNVSSLVKLHEYKGLFNRSRHSGNLSIRYQNEKLKGGAYISAKYRGRFGYNGINGFNNGNDILDDDRKFIDGFTMLNVNFHKQISSNIDTQAGVENLLNYTNKLYMPGIYGRTFFVNVNFKFK